MDNEKYNLNIDDKYVKLFQNNLGFWNPINSDIWFLWNEERFEKNQPVSERIKSISDNNKANVFYDEKNLYFTKLFTDYQDYNDLWGWYNYIRINFNQDLNKFFISEFFFLPSDKWTLIWKTYRLKDSNWNFIKTRNEFYENDNLKLMLEERLVYIFWLLKNYKWKTVYLYWLDNNIEEKIIILQEICKINNFDLIEIENNKIKEFDFYWNKIYFSQYINKQ